MVITVRPILGFAIFFFAALTASSQKVSVELGPDQVGSNQMWTIKITVEDERLKNYSPFPEIDGFVKRGTSSSTSSTFINGRMSSSQSITQNYQPTQQGTIVLDNFEMTINGQIVRVPGKSITIGPPVQRRSTDPFDPFQNLFDRRSEPQEFVEVEADAFLALTTDKADVYVGEGFTTTLAFYVAETNRADMRFFDLGNQITEIVKEIKPANTWEENFNIDNINGEPVEIRGERYTQYKIFQATYYPLNTDPIAFPEVGLKLIKYKRARNRSFFQPSRQEDFETFYSRPKQVTVRELPAHPLRDRVAVGNYRLQERISSETLETGQSFNYAFNIVGEGNISAIEAPNIPENNEFDFYAPNVEQNVRRASNTVRGTKQFDFYAIPNEPGEFDLGHYVQWIYFNPLRETYDTLRSDYTVQVSGESRKNVSISSIDVGTFYDGLQFENNTLRPINQGSLLQILTNIFIFAALTGTLVLAFRK